MNAISFYTKKRDEHVESSYESTVNKDETGLRKGVH